MKTRFPILRRLPFATGPLLIQIVVAALIWQSNLLLQNSGLTGLSVGQAVLMQAVLAALGARIAGYPVWWVWIQAAAPVLLAMALWAQLPQWVYLALFVSSVGWYWTLFTTRVPYYPSSRAACEALAAVLPKSSAKILDIGSGTGKMTRYLKQVRPECDIYGIEVAPLPWLCNILLNKMQGIDVKTMRGAYDTLSLGDFDVVYAYLSPAAMPGLWQKAKREMRPGSLLISNEFDIPGHSPNYTYQVTDGAPLHVWRL